MLLVFVLGAALLCIWRSAEYTHTWRRLNRCGKRSLFTQSHSTELESNFCNVSLRSTGRFNTRMQVVCVFNMYSLCAAFNKTQMRCGSICIYRINYSTEQMAVDRVQRSNALCVDCSCKTSHFAGESLTQELFLLCCKGVDYMWLEY